MTTRTQVILTKSEQAEFTQLKPEPGDAWTFWKKVAAARGLDHRSLIDQKGKLSGLPKGHKHHWCYPIPLQCKQKPVAI